MRNSENSRRGSQSRRNEYVKFPTTGALPKWEMEGFVQDYTEAEKYEMDYVRFCIDHPDDGIFRNGDYTIISITVPWDVAEVDKGDHVRMTGTTRVWKKEDSNIFSIELIAQTCEEVKDDEQTTTRRRSEGVF